jgi:sec-independent protein translocase protein TatB
MEPFESVRRQGAMGSGWREVMPFNLGFTEITVIVVFALLLFGPRKMGTIAKSLGRAYFEFKHEFNKLNSTIMSDLKTNITNDAPKGYSASDPYPPSNDIPPYEYPSYESVKDEEPAKSDDAEPESAQEEKDEDVAEVKSDEPESGASDDKPTAPPAIPPTDALAG